MLHYLLEVETRGSQSLLNIDRFVDPWSYTLRVKKPGSDEQTERPVDLVETFNYLIGLRVAHISAPQWFDAEFERVEDPEVPAGQKTKLAVSGRIRQVREPSAAERAGLWRFQKIEGWLPKDSGLPNNGQQEKVLVVWRSLPAYAQLRTEGEFEGLQGIEGDNLMLDEWFQKMRISTRDFEFDTIYVNGSNNLPNLALADDTWKVRLIEEEFMKRMWDGEGMA
jgi:adenine-specific DNA-methyltransferase